MLTRVQRALSLCPSSSYLLSLPPFLPAGLQHQQTPAPSLSTSLSNSPSLLFNALSFSSLDFFVHLSATFRTGTLMVSSHSFPPIHFPSTSADSWLSQAFARDTQTLTTALYNSLARSISPSPDLVIPEFGVSACSEPETALKCLRNSISRPSGRVSKRKSRASKRTQTTFITVDHANFRQMVQQVTGVRLGNLEATAAPILKAEPQRQSGRLTGGGCLPTLDTSAFLLEHNQVQEQMTGGNGAAAGMPDGGSAGLYFDTFCSFPTLEWRKDM